MVWIYFALSTGFFFTFLNLLQRVLALKSSNFRAIGFIFNFCAAIIALLIFLLSGSFLKNFYLPLGFKAWLVILAASLFYGLFERYRFLAAKLLPASLYAAIGNTGVLVAFFCSLIFYQEQLTGKKIIGSLLIIMALFLISLTNFSLQKSF